MRFIFMCVMLIFVSSLPVGAMAVPTSKNIHTIQVASYLSLDRAMKEMELMRRRGFKPFMLDLYDDQHRLWHSIHIGKYSDFLLAMTERIDFSRKTGKKAIVYSNSSESLALFEDRVLSKDKSESSTQKIATATEASTPVAEKLSTPIKTPAEPVQKTQIEPVQEEPTVVTQGQPESAQKPFLIITDRLYVLASLGLSSTDRSDADLERDLRNRGFFTQASIDGTNFGGKIVGGYQWTEHFGIEAGYVHFQSVDTHIRASAAGAGLINEFVQHAPLTVQGAVIEGVASWDPHPKVSLIGKAGGFLWHGEVQAEDQGVTVTREEEDFDLVLGAGVSFHVWDQRSLRLEYERFFTPDPVNFYSIGLEAGF